MGSNVWVLGRHCVGCGSTFWVSWAGVLGWWLVEFGHWLIYWVGVLGQWWCCGYGGGWLSFGPVVFLAVVGWVLFSDLLKILSFFFLSLSLLLRFLDLEFVGESGDCGCSLWQLICHWWWFSNQFVVSIWLCLFWVVFWVVEEALGCDSGCSGGCWFLVLVATVRHFAMCLYISWVLSKYII